MIDTLMSWEALSIFATLSMVSFTLTEFFKEFKIFKNIPTKYLSFIFALILINLVMIQSGQFKLFDEVLYFISAMFCSLSANGASDFNSYVVKGQTEKDIKAKKTDKKVG